MGKTKKRKQNIDSKINIQKLSDSRDGGQNALRGYSYQLLYSSYLIILLSNPGCSFQLEGIEDIDKIEQKNDNNDVTHIQLKYSINKQDASFLTDVLKNFLEVYLIEPNHSFKLVYDFPVAKGNLSKLLSSNLDDKSRDYWIKTILKIKETNTHWNWSSYDFDKFMTQLSFENVKKITLDTEVEKVLIGSYDITTDNISSFDNSVKVYCLDKMEQRAYITKEDIDNLVQSVKFDISKGAHNTAHSWIRKLNYTKTTVDEHCSFYEGKKATPADIANGISVNRPNLEEDIIKSIHENTITVIKASSGQGKTTLALQVTYMLIKEYTSYQLLCCDKVEEVGDIIQYFKARIQLGEKVLILIDNLDNHFCKWNYFVQQLQSELPCHYKVLITSREIDWYNYSGDLSNIQSLNVIKPTLGKQEAIEIFKVLKGAKKLHCSITNWESAWNKIEKRQLLIEYVYLLTHGEMLLERIAFQMSEIGQSPSGKSKCEILRKVCFADVCGISLAVTSLYKSQTEKNDYDFGELLKSMESEFLLQVNSESGYVEGLHPIRSKHIIDRLHEFIPIGDTALSVIAMARKEDIPILFSHLPEFQINAKDFFDDTVEVLWNENDFSYYILAIQGLFSGSVLQYYRANQDMFDDANAHGGLFIISTEICPFTKVKEFGVSVDTLDKMRETVPENTNIKYLCELRNRFPICDLQETHVYILCDCIYKKLMSLNFLEVTDIVSYAAIAEWIYNIDSGFALLRDISTEDVWSKSCCMTLDTISTLMYLSYCCNKDSYMDFVNKNLDDILTYIKHQTKSHKIFIDSSQNAIHIEYILRLSHAKLGNEQSVARLRLICKTLPIFDVYCADAIKPQVDVLSAYTNLIPDDAHKEMPVRNIVSMFHQDLTSLWNKTIMSNYEFETVAEWLRYWFDIRERICLIADKSCSCIYKLLGKKQLGGLVAETAKLHKEYASVTVGGKLYPKENRPFEEKANAPKGFAKVRKEYFQSIQNFMNQFAGFLFKDEKEQRLAMFNLTAAKSSLVLMQNYFAEITHDFASKERHSRLCVKETQNIERLMMSCAYFKEHTPSKYFDKYEIKEWYDKHCREEMRAAENGFWDLSVEYSIHFPNRIYTIEILSYYPIVVDGFDMISEEKMFEWVCGCISFADTSFDYLVVLSTDKFGEINPTALQFPRQTYVAVKETIEMGNSSISDNLMLPYPVDVTQQMLSCFNEKFSLSEVRLNTDTLPIGDLAEGLWIYSKIFELLTDPKDAEYLTVETQNIEADIEGTLCLLKDKLPPNDIDWLTEICNSVFMEKKFDDVAFNDVIDHFMQKN